MKRHRVIGHVLARVAEGYAFHNLPELEIEADGPDAALCHYVAEFKGRAVGKRGAWGAGSVCRVTCVTESGTVFAMDASVGPDLALRFGPLQCP